ncbi:MAG: hypothetical protein Q8O40_10165 [Chloroflexota bacterium]|nr:hypothetical protein [Chloroflexota bacterium]
MATTRKSTTRRTLGQTLLEGVKVVVPPVLLLGSIALALALLSLVPSRFQAEGPKQYATIEDAELALGTQLLLPGYFPDYLVWPPERIEGQRQPAVQADVTFLDRASRQQALWVHQELSERQEWTPSLPRPATVVERSSEHVNGATAWLVTYRDAQGVTYRQLYWRQDGRLLSVTAIYAQEELERMARTTAP